MRTDFRWDNWGGNQSAHIPLGLAPADEVEATDAIRGAVEAGRHVRVVGSGHSFTPVVASDDVLVDLAALSGVVDVDLERQRAVVLAGSTIAAVGEPLWDRGLSILNQGDVDAQTIAGAIATGTKGSGRFGSMSSTVRAVRLVDGHGAVVDVDGSDPDALHAAQVSIGMLGPMLRVDLQTTATYRLREENTIVHIDELFDRWDEFEAGHRHFSFFWMPRDTSSAMYELGPVPADHAFVKLLHEEPVGDDVPTGQLNARTDRAYRIYPDGTTDAKFHELEYMIGADDVRAAIDVVRTLMLTRFPHEDSPLQVRFQEPDEGFLSPQYGRRTASLSVSGRVGTDYVPFLRAVDEGLQQFDARPHWGKVHFLTRDRVEALYPRYDDFQRVRRAFDPRGLFLNDHLRALFG